MFHKILTSTPWKENPVTTSVSILCCLKPVRSARKHAGVKAKPHTHDIFPSAPCPERLKHTGAARLRHMHHPDEQYGIILNFDTVITNTRMLQSICWQQLAKAHGTVIPPLQNNLVLFNTRPERVIMDVSCLSVNHYFFHQQAPLVKFYAFQPLTFCILHTGVASHFL